MPYQRSLTISDPEDGCVLRGGRAFRGNSFDSEDEATSEEELECCRGMDEWGCSRRRRKTDDRRESEDGKQSTWFGQDLAVMASGCKVILFLLVPIVARQLGIWVGRRWLHRQ